jgi:DNA-directed RNA polymerase specialized sigma subunit
MQMPPIQNTSIDETPDPKVCEFSTAERDRLVLDNLPLVRAIAVRVYENLPSTSISTT